MVLRRVGLEGEGLKQTMLPTNRSLHKVDRPRKSYHTACRLHSQVVIADGQIGSAEKVHFLGKGLYKSSRCLDSIA
jgi:hypothetical protein